jgi:hypothetical protein
MSSRSALLASDRVSVESNENAGFPAEADGLIIEPDGAIQTEVKPARSEARPITQVPTRIATSPTLMSLQVVIVPFATLLLLLTGCSRGERRSSVADTYIPDASSVAFDIEPIKGSSGSQQWTATYTSQGKTAHFRIELGVSHPSKDSSIKSGEGRFVAEAGSDASALLADLQKALEAKNLPKSSGRIANLPFEYANLGDNLSQASGGGFGTKPPGNWTAMKIFIGEGEHEGEMFLNINSTIKKGQFSIKDPDYGDLVLAELAKVL